jgi:hypothetical protein
MLSYECVTPWAQPAAVQPWLMCAQVAHAMPPAGGRATGSAVAAAHTSKDAVLLLWLSFDADGHPWRAPCGCLQGTAWGTCI